MDKVINYILNEVPSEAKSSLSLAAAYVQSNTPRIINLFNDKSDLLFKKGSLNSTINLYTLDPVLNNGYDSAFTYILLAHMTLYFNSQLLSKGENLPLSNYFSYLLRNNTYGLDRDTLNKYL